MNKDDIFKYIQKVVSNPPLILVGSGASASHGLPGMKELGDHLISSLSSKYKYNYSWNKFVENLNSGQDLETALSKLSLDCIIDDIRKETMIKKANSFLCIGYGFNDEQIQEKIITKIRQDIPIVVVTMHLSESAAHLIINNAKNFVTIQKGETPNTTEFCINKEMTVLDGCFWSVEEFMKIID